MPPFVHLIYTIQVGVEYTPAVQEAYIYALNLAVTHSSYTEKTIDTDNSTEKTIDTDNSTEKTIDTDNSTEKTIDTDNSTEKTIDADSSTEKEMP